MREKVIKIISEALKCDPATLKNDSGLSTHEKWDSLGQVSIAAELEKHFGITVDESNIFKITTVADIIQYLVEQVK